MSQDKVGLVRAGFEAFARGDIEAVLRLCDDDIVVTQPSEMPDAAPLPRGHAGVLANIAAWPEQFDDYRIEILRTVETADHVVATVHQSGRGKSTGIPVETEATMVFAIREGKIAQWRIFLDEDEAFRAVGLRSSRDNVEVVRESLMAFAERGLDAVTEFWAGDINWRAIEGAPDDVGEMQGPDAVRRYLQDWIDIFDNVRNVPEELLDIGDDRVLAVQHATGRAKSSGVETDIRYAVIYTLRDGKIVRAREYIDREQALEAAGLRGSP